MALVPADGIGVESFSDASPRPEQWSQSLLTSTHSSDILSVMVEATVPAVAAVAGIPVQAGPPVTVSPAQAIATSGSMMNRSQLTAGAGSGSLITIVPAGGLVTARGAVDARTLAGALADGAAAGIAAAGGPVCQQSAPTLVASAAGLNLTGMQAVAFDLLAGARTVSVVLIVEATLGSLLGGSIPVDEPAMGEPSVAPAQLPSLDRVGIVPANRPIETLKDVVTRFSVEIARGTVHVRDLVTMGPGQRVRARSRGRGCRRCPGQRRDGRSWRHRGHRQAARCSHHQDLRGRSMLAVNLLVRCAPRLSLVVITVPLVLWWYVRKQRGSLAEPSPNHRQSRAWQEHLGSGYRSR